MTFKLNQQNLARVPGHIATPTYDRTKVGQNIVHIGIGGFHRAHQAVYAEDLFLLNESLDWGICGIGLLPGDVAMKNALEEQDYLYTLVERESEGDKARIVGSIVNYLYAPDDKEAVLEKLASPQTRIVSLTITEGGYYIHSGTNEFDQAHPDIQFDLANPGSPRSAFGFLLEGLKRRRERRIPPFTILSCDNIQGNGAVARKMLLAFAELANPELAVWMAQNVSFPNSMVDRITPATKDMHRQLVKEITGIDDLWPVTTEGFKQWVIEDKFPLGRPAWEKAGVQITEDVLPYEKMKLRLLNASHQALCYIGILLGYEFVHQTMEDADIRRFVELFLEEVTPVLPEVPGVNLSDYKRTLIHRYSNPAICDQLSRIGIYGSSGIPKFLLPSIEEQLENKGKIHYMAFTIASWFRYLDGLDEAGNSIIMKDPDAGRLHQIAHSANKTAQLFLNDRSVFSEKLAHSTVFADLVQQYLTAMYREGVRNALQKVIGGQ